MRQKRKSKVEILEKKLQDIARGKWRASESEVIRLREALEQAKKGGK